MARLTFFFFLCFWQALAWAQKPALLLERAFFKDPSARLTVEQAATADFERYEGNLALGFQSGVVWARLTLDGSAAGPDGVTQRRILRVGPNYLERIELYMQSEGRWQRHVRGALMPQASGHCPDDMHCFVIEPSAQEVSTLYLRVEHRGFLVTQIEVLSVDDLPQAVAKRARDITRSMVIALGLLVLGGVFLLTDRSLLLAVYCAFQLTVVLFVASNAGLVAAALPEASGQWLNHFNSLLYVLRVTATVLLAWAILRLHQPSAVYLWVAKVLLLMCMVNALLVLSGHVQMGLRGSLLVFAILPLWQLYGTLSAKSLPAGQRRLLIAGTVIYILMLALGVWMNFTQQPTASNLGLVRQIVDWRLNGFGIGVLFFWLTMLERSSQKRTKVAELDALRHQAMEARTRQAELDERSALIDMLTHELKNPLATIGFALASLRSTLSSPDALKRVQSIDLSARRMDGLIERVANFNKIERAMPVHASTVLDAATLIQDGLTELVETERWQIEVQPGAAFRCDRQMLGVILENLMSNASKYSLPEHPIRIEVASEEVAMTEADGAARPAARMTRVEISNHVDPTCVPEEAIVFDPYYRHPNVQSQAGMGLGLSVVKSAVHKIGGNIAYRHEQGRVFFTLRVPA